MTSFKLNQKLLFILIPIIVLVVILGLIFSRPSYFLGQFFEKSQSILDSFKEKADFNKSEVEILRNGEKLVLNFYIDEEDKLKAEAFSQSLGIGKDWQQGLTLGFDQKTLDNLPFNLPIKLNLSFEENKLIFKNHNLKLLNSSLPTSEYNFSTESGKLNLKVSGDRNYYLEIENLDSLLKYATVSGELAISKKIESPLFPILAKVVKIMVSVNGKSVYGEITLR